MASTAAAAKAQADQAKATGNFQNKRYSEASKSAMESYLFQSNQTYQREAQEVAAASGQAESVRQQASKAQGAAAASAGARGVGGSSVADLLREFDQVDSLTSSNIKTNLDWRRTQLGNQVRGLQADAQGRVSSVAPAPVFGPDKLAFGIDLLGAGLGAGRDYYQMEQAANKGSTQ